MKRLVASILFAFCMGLPSLAQTGDVPGAPQDASPVDRLDAWLRIEEANRRCASLYTFESREIERRVKAALDFTQPAKDAKAAAGSAGFEAKFADMQDLLAGRRAAMAEAVAGETCEALAAGPMLDGRRVYMRNFLQLALVVNSYGEHELKPAHTTQGFLIFGDILRKLYGDDFDEVAQALAAELNRNPPPQGRAWKLLEPSLIDIAWQVRLNASGFVMQPHRDAAGWMSFLKNGEPHPRWGRFGRAREVWVDGDDGNRQALLRAQGKTRKGQIAFVVTEPNRSADGPPDLRLAVLSQDEPGTGAWSRADWRAGASLFEAELDTGQDCPGDACFILPSAVSDLVAARQAGDEGFFYYEVFIGREADFPPAESAQDHEREQFFPPRFVEK